MNAIVSKAELAPSVDPAINRSVELLYTPSESIFAAAAPDMVKKGWSVFPQEVNRRPGTVYGEMIKVDKDHDLKNKLPTPETMNRWCNHCSTLNIACVFGPGSGDTFALDIDILDEELAKAITDLAEDMLGYTPLRRVGMRPKIALIYRHAPGDIVKSISRYIAEADDTASEHAVEIQGEGKPLTLHGRHHKTGAYFTWQDADPQLVGPDAAPLVTSEQVDSFMGAVDQIYGFAAVGAASSAKSSQAGTWTVDGQIQAGEKSSDGRENALFKLVIKIATSFKHDFWDAIEAGPDALMEYRKAKLVEICNAFAAENELTGRWAPHLLEGEARDRLNRWIDKIKDGKRPAANKMQKAEKKGEAPTLPDDGRPVIQLAAGDIRSTVDAAEQALIASGIGIYQRAGQIVAVAEVPMAAADASEATILVKKITEQGDYALREVLTAAASFVRWDGRKDDWTKTDAPMDIVKTLRERSRLRLPVLNGVISAPTMRRDGSILDVPGYDAASGLLYDPQGAVFKPIADKPTHHQAKQSLRLLRTLIRTFPFVGPADEGCILAMLLTACVRRNLPAAPLFAISAVAPGSGKSKLANLASVLATGRTVPSMNQAPRIEETEKRISGFLLSGIHQIAIDNVNEPLDGDLLNTMLTEPTVSVRIFGSQQMPEMPTNALATATGNNIVLVGDLTRRALLGRLDAGVANPHERQFDVEPIEQAQKHRASLVHAALTIMRAYHVADRPKQAGKPIGSFEVWARTVRDALMWVGVADPVATQDTARSMDPKLDNMNNLLTQWYEAVGTRRITVSEMITKATEVEAGQYRGDLVHKALFDALATVAGNSGVLNANRLGRWLTAHAGRIVDGIRLVKDGEKHKVACWRMDVLPERLAAEQADAEEAVRLHDAKVIQINQPSKLTAATEAKRMDMASKGLTA